MDRNREHFDLPVWRDALARRKQGRGRQPNRDREIHGGELVQQAEALTERLAERPAQAPDGINPKLIFKLQLHPQANLEETYLGQLGLKLLARDPERAIVVFPNEATLSTMLQHLREYAGQVANGHQYAYVAAIDNIAELTAADRIGPRLESQPLGDDEVLALDIELWHSGNEAECRAWIEEIRQFLESYSLRVLDSWVGRSLCLLRAQLNSEALAMLAEIDYVKEIDRRPEPSFEMGTIIRTSITNFDIEDPADDLVGVVVIDSGIMQAHPLLRKVVGDAQVFPDRMRLRITGGAEDGDQRTNGHGTAVAGLAVYDNVGRCIMERTFEPSALLFSARITDDNNEYDEDELVEHQLADAVEYFVTNYPIAKVINISLGDRKRIYDEGRYQFRFAALIDELAYRYRDQNIVFVVSAGNFDPVSELDEEAVVANYPGYLLTSPRARLIDPATAAIALTVGGLSYGEGRAVSTLNADDTSRLIAGEEGWPAPFTRTGWGIDGALKPDVVDFAGDMRFARGMILREPVQAGIPTTAKNFSPPSGQLFRTVAGTSFSAPRVANLAARLFRAFPRASSNLIRALIADSGRIPGSRPAPLRDKQPWDEDLLRLYGYGQPDFNRARWSNRNKVLLIVDEQIELDTFRIFTVPALPQEFFHASGSGFISVTLAFDPPTRHTRADSYLGITMDFGLYKNVAPESIAGAIRLWNKTEIESLPEGVLPPSLGTLRSTGQTGGMPFQVNLQPGVNRRRKSTLQRAWERVTSRSWSYNGDPLTLAVICQRKWAPADVTTQRFSVIVSLYHENPLVDLLTHVEQEIRLTQRVRVRI